MPAPKISSALDRIADDIRKNYFLRGLPRQEFAVQAADLFAAVNEIHAFREGNGRTSASSSWSWRNTRPFVDFSIISKERMVQASIAANEQGDNSVMRRMFNEIAIPIGLQPFAQRLKP